MAIKADEIPDLMTRRQAAAFLGVSVTTVDRMIHSRELEHVRIRSSVRVTKRACVDALRGPLRREVTERRASRRAAREAGRGE